MRQAKKMTSTASDGTTPIWLVQVRNGICPGQTRTFCAAVPDESAAIELVKGYAHLDESAVVDPIGQLSEPATALIVQNYGLGAGCVMPWPSQQLDC
jgi:hypothetical protein